MANIIDVKKLVDETQENIKLRVEALKKKGKIPKMVVILANCNADSIIYVNRKEKLCEKLGIVSEKIVLPIQTTNEKLIEVIENLNNDETVFGILLQMPLFKHLDSDKCILKISPSKDVDGLTPENIGKLVMGIDTVIPCTAKGVMKILEYANVEIEGKKVVVFGRSTLVGKPVYNLMLNKDAQVQICHTKTPNAKEISKEADIVVVAIGNEKLITEEYIKNGATVIDVGINRNEQTGKIVGDVDFESVVKVAGNITKVPGGVGLTTVMCLCENLVEIMEKR